MTEEIQEFNLNTSVPVPQGADNLGDSFGDTEPTTQRQPWLKLIQSNSPELKPDHERYISDAKQGMFVNSANGQTFTSPLTIIPVRYTRSFVEWSKETGRVVGRYTAQDEYTKSALRANGNSTIKLKSHINPENDFNDTRYLFALVVDSIDQDEVTFENAQPVIISFKATHIKAIETALRLARNIAMGGEETRELYSFGFQLASASVENKQKQQYYIPSLSVMQGEVSDALQGRAIEFYSWLNDGGLEQVLRTESGNNDGGGAATVIDATTEETPY